MNIQNRTIQIKNIVGGRKLCWFGVRGIDGLPLAKYGTLSHIYSHIAPVYKSIDVYEKCLETIFMHRIDLNTYNIDTDINSHTREFKRSVLFGVKDDIILVPYRPQEFLSSIYFTHGDTVSYYGLFHKFQRIFEHKPWVESSLQEAGINTIPWEYVRNIEKDMVIEKISSGNSVLIRPPYTSGGAGYAFIRKIEDIYTNPVSASDDGFFSVSPYFSASVPLNVNACIYRSGEVRAFLPSLQIIGIKDATTRHLGYCGNDFGTIKQLGQTVVNGMEEITGQVGRWLAKKEYIGIFGIDMLLVGDNIYVVEINPRFQGSTQLASVVAGNTGDADPYGEHLASFAGLDAPVLPPLWERTKDVEDTAHLVAYNTFPRDISLISQAAEKLSNDYKGIPHPHVTIAPEGMIFKQVFKRCITPDGNSLFPEITLQMKQTLQDIIKD